MKFHLYKGLKKPLIFFGLKGKYIYQALGVAALTIFGAALASNFGGIIATAIVFAIGGGTLSFIFKRQDKKGLYDKKKTKGQVLIYPKNPAIIKGRKKIKGNEIKKSRF